MNLEWILALTLFMTAVLLTIYIGEVSTKLAYMKYVFEATKHAECSPYNYTEYGLVVAMCVEVKYNDTIVVSLYNVTVSPPGR